MHKTSIDCKQKEKEWAWKNEKQEKHGHAQSIFGSPAMETFIVMKLHQPQIYRRPRAF